MPPSQCAAKLLPLSALALFALSGCHQKNPSKQESNMDIPTPRLQAIFQKTKSVCMGRLVMDVPATAHVIFGYARVHSTIRRLPGAGGNADIQIQKRLDILEQERIYAHKMLKDGPEAKYGKVIDGALPTHKILVGVDLGSGVHYKLESYIKLGSDLFIQETKARTAEQIRENGGSGSFLDAVAELNHTAKNIRSRDENEVPSDTGVCIDGAFIAKPLAESGENFALGIRLNEFPDAHFSINTRVSDRDTEQETIDEIQRLQKDAERAAQRSGHGAWYAGIKFLRRGEREFNGGRGYEILARKPAQGNGTENHQFVFHGGGEANNELRPAFEMQLDTGAGKQQTARVPPSLTDEEAIALWDKLVGSIRVRPTSKKTSQAAPPRIPLNNLQLSGRTCPQTGWWECDDPLPLAQASSGVWLEAGQRMPMVRVWLRPNWWQQWKGERPTGQRAATWRLASYDAPPTVPPPRKG